MQEGNTDAQYNAARILRHLAMGGSPLGKTAARQAIPALVQGLKVRTARYLRRTSDITCCKP